MNNAELVAILLRSGIAGENAINLATRILAEFEGLSGLARAGYGELFGQRGLSHAKTCEILAALELGKRIASLAPEERAQIGCPEDAANLVAAEMALLTQEHLVVLLLNTRNQVVARREIYIGTVNSSAVRPAEVLRPAIRENAPSIIVVHNHPSGDPDAEPGGRGCHARSDGRREADGYRIAGPSGDRTRRTFHEFERKEAGV